MALPQQRLPPDTGGVTKAPSPGAEEQGTQTGMRSLPLLPRTRAECPPRRTCVHTSCRYHLPGDCALDVAEDGPQSAQVIADYLGISRERVNQIAQAGINKLVGLLGKDGLRELLERSGTKELHLLAQLSQEPSTPSTDLVRRSEIKVAPPVRRKVSVPRDTLVTRVQAYLKEHGPTMRSDLWKAMGLTGPLRLNKAISTLRTRGLLDGGGNKHHPQPYYLK